MAVFGRFQVYYGKIKSELEIIREDYEYTNLSKAFAHWYLVNHVKVSEQEIGETIIDGNGDNGCGYPVDLPGPSAHGAPPYTASFWPLPLSVLYLKKQ